MMHNKEAEKALLGCLILENSLINKANAVITEEDFFFLDNRKLYAEVITKYSTTKSVDITVLQSCDIEYLVSVCDVLTVSNFQMYLDDVKNKSIKRQVAKQLDEIKAKINDDAEDITEIKTSLFEAARTIQGETKITTTTMADILIETMNNLEKQYNQGLTAYKKWGLPWMDDKTGGVKPALTILAARPSVGKSALALQLAVNVAMQDAKVAFFGLEMPNEQNMIRLLSNVGKINKNYFDKPWTLDERAWIQIGTTASKVSELNITFFDTIFKVDEIILKCEELIADKGLDFVIIDYLQLVEASKNYKTTNDKVSYISRTLKKFQQQNKIHVLALSQLNRETEKQNYPTLANLRDSGSLEQDADNVWFIHPDNMDYEESKKADYIDVSLILAKQRGADRNLLKHLKFYGAMQKFYEN